MGGRSRCPSDDRYLSDDRHCSRERLVGSRCNCCGGDFRYVASFACTRIQELVAPKPVAPKPVAPKPVAPEPVAPRLTLALASGSSVISRTIMRRGGWSSGLPRYSLIYKRGDHGSHAMPFGNDSLTSGSA